MPPVIECVVNVSDGRRAPVIDEMARAVGAVEEVVLRDVSSDPSHDRTVLTMLGTAPALHRATLALYAVAVDRIDLRRHHGVHPRMGAVDVVPFVPLRRATMGHCIDLATAVARDVAGRFSIPVFLYGEAATRPERRALENVRRGGFEHLRDRMASPEGHPDFGPPAPHPTAGASAIGARPILIAFNVNLRSRDLAVAREIARTIRERDGGLPGVKALGLPLSERGLVQVSINLVDYTRTPLHVVFERVHSEAHARGVDIEDTEIVGLVPQDALFEAARHAIRLARLTESQVLESGGPAAGRWPGPATGAT